jgi:ubiquinone biosynthesis protein COQ9
MTLDELREAAGAFAGQPAAFDGWSERAIAMAAAELGVPAERARIAFPDGPVQMIDAWFDWVDRHMLAAFSRSGSKG